MHGRSGEKPNSPPEYRLHPHILIHVWIDIHCLYKRLFAVYGLATGEVGTFACTTPGILGRGYGQIEPLVVCAKAVENFQSVLVRVLVNPHREGTLAPLLSQKPQRGDNEHISTGAATHGLQPLQHFFGNPHRLAFVHPPNILRHHERRPTGS